VDYRTATPADAEAVAALHADSWRRAYRGMYSDEFLDGDLPGERLRVWEPRLNDPPSNQYVLLAVDDGELAGFVCGYADDDPTWGSLIDNLHVRIDYRRQGIAAELMRRAAEWFSENASRPLFYLWVIEDNTPARRFYEMLGATNSETVSKTLPSGNPGRVCRYTWPDAVSLGRRD
jgi:ribosomal protein S18 acetylase RimI-like enzyme